MSHNPTFTLLVSFISDFIITAGGSVVIAMTATKEVSLPSTPVLVLAIVLGAVQAARRAQAKLDPSVVQDAAPLRTSQQLMEQIRENQAAADTVAEAVVRKLGTEITPRRADDVKPTKDSS